MMECKKKKTPPGNATDPAQEKQSSSWTCNETETPLTSVPASHHQPLEHSPGTLMSCLQQKRCPWWKVRNNDLAIEEILRDRKAAIESGKLKGRRLFESLESATVIGLDSWVRPESEVRSVISQESNDDENENSGGPEGLTHVFVHSSSRSSVSSSSDCKGELDKGEELMMKVENVMKTSIENGRGIDDRAGRRRRWIVVVYWLLIGLIIGAVGIVSTKIVNGCQDHRKASFVPT